MNLYVYLAVVRWYDYVTGLEAAERHFGAIGMRNEEEARDYVYQTYATDRPDNTILQGVDVKLTTAASQFTGPDGLEYEIIVRPKQG